jgi:hypothetical protein
MMQQHSQIRQEFDQGDRSYHLLIQNIANPLIRKKMRQDFLSHPLFIPITSPLHRVGQPTQVVSHSVTAGRFLRPLSESNRVTPDLEPVGRSSKRFWQDIAIPIQPLAAKPPRFKNLGYPYQAFLFFL